MRSKEMRIADWMTRRDRCEADHVPIYVDGQEIGVKMISLPRMQIGKVNHAQYELVHVMRVPKSDYLSSLQPGLHYSMVDGQPWADYFSIVQWEPRNRQHECGPDCKACRLSCNCGCVSEPAAVDLFQSTVINIGPDDIVKYHHYAADGSRQITVTRPGPKVGDK